MKCNEIEEFVILLADNEIDDLNRKRVLEHIEICETCKQKYRETLNMKNMISFNLSDEDLSDLNLYTVASKKKKWRHVFMKKRILAASVAIALVISIFIPINGRSFADSIKGWFDKTTITTEKGRYSIHTDFDGIRRSDELDYSRAAKHAYFKNIEEAKTQTSKDVPVPKFIPKDYEFEFIYSNYFTEGHYEDMHLRYASKYELKDVEEGKFPTRDCIDITYDYPSGYMSREYNISYVERSMVKPITVKGYDGYMVYTPRNEDIDTDYIATNIGLTLFIESETFFTVDVTNRISSKEPSESEIEEIEKQLIKIMESIIEN